MYLTLIVLQQFFYILLLFGSFKCFIILIFCRNALDELNDANIHTLRILLSHLRLVSERCAENKMSAENLATIFSPTIFCTGTVPALPQQQHMLLHFLIVTKNVTK